MRFTHGCGGLISTLVFLVASVQAQSNVLILVADDLGIDMLATYGQGSDLPQTPTLDSMAARGVQFQNAWSNPVCSTTRATILTGRYSFRTGVGTIVDENWALQPGEWILPEILDQQVSGYAHAAIGKWHLGNTSVGGASAPNLAGFSHFAGALANLPNYFNWTYVVNGTSVQSEAYATTQTTQDAINWIDATPEPWLCYVAFNAPHAPFHAPPPSLHSVNLGGVGSPLENPRPYYKAMVEAMDTEIGRLFEALGTRIDSTHVLFVGDNGTSAEVTVAPFLPSHAKGTVYQGGVQVPLIVTGPWVMEKGSQCDALVSTADLFATVLEIAGVQAPTGVEIDAISLAPYFADPALPSLREVAFAELFAPNGFGPYTILRRAVRDDRFKLVANDLPVGEGQPWQAPHTPEEQLFDVELDPFESVNLVQGPPTVEAKRALDRLNRSMLRILGN